ncbi:hypothetical protein chiPu_0011872 [Chiloscyllium punctatum]|uniref:SH2 domain-containing protein n=1 Tax=Chiloscyllium punctatum TaxID=137246 RepID=A0A401SSR6_CHIPU|nr:hypothetical protein [Chiloscyllium punctatum]
MVCPICDLTVAKVTAMDRTVTRKAAITWFTTTQAAKLMRGGTVPDWFYGITTRREAEHLLKDKPQGCFLIRVGESRIGFSLSYRAFDRCRHFIIDVTTDGQYNITGESIFHNSLQDLVNYHSQFPIDPYTECLTIPCEQLSQSTVRYEELCIFVPTMETQSSPNRHSRSSVESSDPVPSDSAPDRWTANQSKQVPIPPQRLPIDHSNPRPIPPQREPIDHSNPRPNPPQRLPIDHSNPRPIPPQRDPIDHDFNMKYPGDSPSTVNGDDLPFPTQNNSHHSPRVTHDQDLSQGQSLPQGQPHKPTICSMQFGKKETVEGAQLLTEGQQESGSFDLPVEYMTPPPYAPGY